MAARTDVLLGESANRRGAPVSQPRPVTTPAGTAAISGASAVFRRLFPTQRATATSRIRGCLRLIATVLKNVLRVRRDPDIGQERLQVHLVGRQGDQQSSHVRERLDRH
jgi:hypothetical protein